LRLTFLGGVGTVTGSKALLELGRRRFLIDCGLFQGFKQLRSRNWERLPIEPKSIDAVVLTHAHLDHAGYLPLLTKNGFKGPVHATPGTRDLSAILLPDSGHLQELDADYANRHGFSKHRPALPLYTRADAVRALERFEATPFGRARELGGGAMLRFHRAGHIVGAAHVAIEWRGRRIVFSGDIGRPRDPVMRPPAAPDRADILVVESTYGDRRHPTTDPEAALGDIVRRTAKRGGSVVIPAFAVGRSQALLYHLWRLKSAERIPDLPIFLDSPMAIEASAAFAKHSADRRLSAAECRAVCAVARATPSVEESKAIDANPVPSVIVSASGMATGGRVLHHLKTFAPDPRSTIVFAGFQAGGTRGAAMIAGAKEIKIHGAMVPIRAEVATLDMLSAHADADEIMDWSRAIRRPPRMTFVVHGEPAAADALRRRIESELGWPCRVPDYRDSYELD
jgi:metallo-beta-lactamase family protein